MTSWECKLVQALFQENLSLFLKTTSVIPFLKICATAIAMHVFNY